jgi:hypothetical protein
MVGFPVQNFDIVGGVAVKYVRCVLLGYVKMLLTLWFDKSDKNENRVSSKMSRVE